MPVPAPASSDTLDGHPIEIRRSRGRVHAACAPLGLHASGADANSALTALDEALADRRRFEAESGLSWPVMSAGGATASPSSPAVKRWAVLLLVTGLVAFQLSYAISTGLSRGIDRAFSAEWRDGLLASLEQQVLAMADPKHTPGADQQRRLVETVRALKSRYGPVWDEIVAERKPAPEGPRDRAR